MPGRVTFATCNNLINCYEGHDNIYEWEACVEKGVHAGMHGWLGGAWDCQVCVRMK
ncbi:unnamed protein product [Discosporangium mesarthrocarpum]